MRVVNPRFKVMVHHLIFLESIDHLLINPIHTIILCRQDCSRDVMFRSAMLAPSLGKTLSISVSRPMSFFPAHGNIYCLKDGHHYHHWHPPYHHRCAVGIRKPWVPMCSHIAYPALGDAYNLKDKTYNYRSPRLS
jgi:hypothetical protein